MALSGRSYIRPTQAVKLLRSVINFSIPTNIYLMGMPGSGKSTLGKSISNELGISFYDLDQYIEIHAEKDITSIFTEDGEDGFRSIESNCLQRLSEQPQPKAIATGGGTPCFHNNMDYMNNHGVGIFLDVPLEVLVERLLEQGTGGRPLLQKKNPTELLRQLHDHFLQRKNFYLQAQIHMKGSAISGKTVITQLKNLKT